MIATVAVEGHRDDLRVHFGSRLCENVIGPKFSFSYVLVGEKNIRR